MTRVQRLRRRLFVGLLVSGLGSSCATSAPAGRTPEDTIAAFSRALSEGKLDEAYALMSEEYKARVTLEQWRAALETNPEESAELIDALTRVRGPIEQVAVLRYGAGQELELRKSGEHWLVSGNVAPFYDQSTPRAALVTFVRAMERKRYDVVLRLVPNADKEGMTTERMQAAFGGESREEVERILTSLRASLDRPIEVIGDHATMPYGERSRVQFVREDGVWKIEDPR